jgi:non-specific serine/threonine protein kinase
MGTPPVTSFRFGGFELQPATRRLLAQGQPVAMGARAFNLLLALAERAGKRVSKDELLDLVWPNLVVEENNIQVQVSTLRKILGADAIATIPGYGYQLTLDATREVSEPRLPAPAGTHNLPRQATSFVGRGQALAEIRDSVAKTRLLTLVGFGGMGKSRLAIEVAASVLAEYSDGVWLAEMAPLTDPRLVPQAVASVLGVTEKAGRPVIEALLEHLRNRRALLVLDCCEHVLAACAELAGQMLQAAPQLTILATSRERLGLDGEATYLVEPLALPESRGSIAAQALRQYDAVRLFVDRAVAAQPAFELTAATAPLVADVCHRVEGIPLAIELAAARLRTMSLENLAARLGERLRLLTRGDPRAAPRQQTLRALIDWSYDHLTEPQQRLFSRLAVFVGGWTLDAAEAVGAGDGLAAVDILDTMSDLIEKSLVVMDGDGKRYRMLDTVREYALSRLDESKDAGATRDRHLAFYLAFAERGRTQFFGPEQGSWYARFDLERDNLLAAHAWCERAAGAAEAGLRLVYAISLYWIHRGGLQLGQRVTLEALARPGAQTRNLARCRAVYIAAQITSCMGRYADSEGYAEESLAIAREIGDGERIAIALMSLALQLAVEDRPRARAYSEEAVAQARRVNLRLLLASALGMLAELERVDGNLDAAEPLYVEALALARESAESRTIAVQLINLASVSIARGSVEPARPRLVEALGIVEQLGSKPLVANVLQIVTGYAACSGDWQRTAQLHGATVALCEQSGYRLDPADEAFLVPLLTRAREVLGEPAFSAAEAAGRSLSYDAILIDARALLRQSLASVAAS